jgi:hypothetical protein
MLDLSQLWQVFFSFHSIILKQEVNLGHPTENALVTVVRAFYFLEPCSDEQNFLCSIILSQLCLCSTVRIWPWNAQYRI